MSTLDGTRSPATNLPPLEAGQRLDRATFHQRYEAMPPNTRAELIGGIVQMPSPLGPEHGDQNLPVAYWIAHFQRATPGVRGSLNTSTALDELGEPQPDCSLRILPECGGQTRHDPRYIVGAPELVIEIARTSRRIDLGPKLADYQRAGVLEYVVLLLDPDAVRWFVRRGGLLVPVAPGPDGLFRSEVFPGLWLDPAALFADDLDGLITVLDRGLATPEHADFVARLAERRLGG